MYGCAGENKRECERTGSRMFWTFFSPLSDGQISLFALSPLQRGSYSNPSVLSPRKRLCTSEGDKVIAFPHLVRGVLLDIVRKGRYDMSKGHIELSIFRYIVSNFLYIEVSYRTFDNSKYRIELSIFRSIVSNFRYIAISCRTFDISNAVLNFRCFKIPYRTFRQFVTHAFVHIIP